MSLISSKAAGNNPCIAIRMENRAVLLYRLESDTNLVPIFSVELDCSVPAVLAFAKNNKDVIVFGMKDRNVSD